MRGVQVSRRGVLAALVAAFGCDVVPAARARQMEPVFSPYADPLNRFSLAVPEGWVPLRPTVPEIIGAWGVRDDPAATFLVIRVPLPPDTTGEAFAGAYLSSIRALPGYADLGSRTVTVAAQDAPLLDYTLPEGDSGANRRIRVQQVFLTRGVEGTILSFRCPYDLAPAYAVPVGMMVGSFTL